MRVAAPIVAVVMLLTACGSSNDSTASTEESSADAATVTTIRSDTTIPGGASTEDTTDLDTVPSTTTVEATTTEAPTTTEAAPTELADLDSLATITILTPTDGNGPRPLLEWEPVNGAVHYLLTVTPPDDVAYWAWSGAESMVWFGGTHEQPPDGVAGPTLFEPMELRVVAVDDADRIIAASQPALINP